MFDLSTVILLALISSIAAVFWQFRRLGERAQSYAQHYCKQHQLQYLDLARQHGRFTMGKRGPVWQTAFSFGFSSDRENRYEGELIFANTQLVKVSLPVYRVPDSEASAGTTSTTQHSASGPSTDYRPTDWYRH